MEAGTELDIPVVDAVIEIPKTTLELVINAKIYHEGELVTVTQKLDMDAVRSAVKEAEENYFPDDATFTLTDYGRKLAEEIERENSGFGDF